VDDRFRRVRGWNEGSPADMADAGVIEGVIELVEV
jgi:hypothetical protein